MSNNDLYCEKCKSHHHPVSCPIDEITDIVDMGSICITPEKCRKLEKENMGLKEKIRKLEARLDFLLEGCDMDEFEEQFRENNQ